MSLRPAAAVAQQRNARRIADETSNAAAQGRPSEAQLFAAKFGCLSFVFVVLLALLVLLLALPSPSQISDPEPDVNYLLLTSTGAGQALSSSGSSSGGASGQGIGAAATGSSEARDDPACRISAVEIGFAKCSEPLVTALAVDSLFYPNASASLGNCVVPYNSTALMQFITVQATSGRPSHYWSLLDSNSRQLQAEYNSGNTTLPTWVMTPNATRSFELRSYFVDPDPAYEFEGRLRQCLGLFNFTLSGESCDCSRGTPNVTTQLGTPCDCSGLTAPAAIPGVNATEPLPLASSFSSTGISRSSSSSTGAGNASQSTSTGV